MASPAKTLAPDLATLDLDEEIRRLKRERNAVILAHYYQESEIQEYGRVMAGMLKRVAPLSYEAWIDYDVCGGRVSRMELDVLRQLIRADGDTLRAQDGKSLDPAALADRGLAKREAAELLQKLEPKPVPDFELDLSRASSAEVFAERFAEAVPKVDKSRVT